MELTSTFLLIMLLLLMVTIATLQLWIMIDDVITKHKQNKQIDEAFERLIENICMLDDEEGYEIEIE